MSSILIRKTVVNDKYIYDISSNRIVFNGATRKVNLNMCGNVNENGKKLNECDISELPKYLNTDINIIGLICSCHIKYCGL